MFHKTNQFGEALKCFTRALDLLKEDKLVRKIKNRSKDRQVYISRGLVYQDMANHLFAINDFNKAAQLDPEDPQAFIHRGVSKLKLRRYDEAIDDFNL